MINVPDEQLNVPYIEAGVYEHYKGNKYEVIGIALDSENLQPCVIYKPLYESKVSYWVRPYDMFVGTVLISGKEVPRFKKVS
ncbi:DUF1653 domain-containing protein [Patescibacteria group bacterium]|nr:MAG: DUF1653 domain-containing protein [Patescibacteria group bacterium]